jgi:outer membrane protein OmpA-like peptidoglycan-associated protein
MRTALFALCLLQFVSVFGQQAETQSHSVYFERDKSEISTNEVTQLKNWLTSLPDSVKKLEVVGRTDFLGSTEHNLKLSENRASMVMNLIENSELLRYRMSLVSSVGEENSIDNGDVEGNPKDRVVELIAHLYPLPTPKESTETAEQPVEIQTSRATEMLENAEVGQSIVFGNLNFFPGRHFLVPQALPELEDLVESLKRNPEISIEIIGHICCKLDSIDGLDVNTRTYTLSTNRAKYIHDQLVLAGISEQRLTYKGMAGSRPLVFPELTEEDQARNRRVEIKVTGR